MSDDLGVCAACDHPAIREPKGYDAYCQACLDKLFGECPKCGRECLNSEMETVVTCQQTRWEPAETEAWCERCCLNAEREPDCD